MHVFSCSTEKYKLKCDLIVLQFSLLKKITGLQTVRIQINSLFIFFFRQRFDLHALPRAKASPSSNGDLNLIHYKLIACHVRSD